MARNNGYVKFMIGSRPGTNEENVDVESFFHLKIFLDEYIAGFLHFFSSHINEMLLLPDEILLAIANWLDKERDISALARTSRRCFNSLEDLLYRKNARCSSGSALEWAACYGQKETAWKAIIFGTREMSECESDRWIQDALLISLARGHTGITKILLEIDEVKDKLKLFHGTQELFFCAVKGGHRVIAELLFELQAISIDPRDRNGRTPLSWAAACGRESSCRALLKFGASLGSRDNCGRTPLSWAARCGRESTVKLLLSSGAEVDPEDNDGHTPLWFALNNRLETKGREDTREIKKRITVIQLLLDWGANPNSSNSDGFTPLTRAIAKFYVSVSRFLYDLGATFIARISHQELLLSLAWIRGHEHIVKLLWDTCANNDGVDLPQNATDCFESICKFLIELESAIELRDKICDISPSSVWTSYCWTLFEILLRFESLIVWPSNYNPTSLSQATQKCRESIVKNLLLLGATIDTRKTYDLTLPSLALASTSSYFDIVKLLKVSSFEFSPHQSGSRLLCWASKMGYQDVVRLLLRLGADPNLKVRDVYLDPPDPLSWAIEGGHIGIVKNLLHWGAKVNSGGSQTPLSRAVKKGHIEIVRLLLDLGAKSDPGGSERENPTPLSWAVSQGHADIAKLLLDSGADFDKKGSGKYRGHWSHTPLSLAAENGHEDIVKLLLVSGAQVNPGSASEPAAISCASEKGYVNIVQILFDSGADIDWKGRGCFGDPPILLASENGHADIVELLLYLGAQIDQKNSSMLTALFRAAYNGHESIVKLLLDTGKVDINIVNWQGWTPLSCAVARGYTSIVKLLLGSGRAVVDFRHASNPTPLLLALREGDSCVVQLLLNHGADFECRNCYGQTPLSLAAQRGYKDVLMLLLDAGAEIDSRDDLGRTPLSMAATYNEESIVKVLLELGADVHSRDADGRTPLSRAAASSYLPLIPKRLLEFGADVNSRDHTGRTPLSWAAESGRQSICEALLTSGAVVHTKDNSG